MRRLSSILALVAIVSSVLSPVWASNMDASHPMLCHRVHSTSAQEPPKHHCEGMDEEQGSSDGAAAVLQRLTSHDCPMNCCLQANPRTAAALPATHFLPLLVTVENGLRVSSIRFSNTGFSSHTDRGPPLL
jgi:hypothetical protein